MFAELLTREEQEALLSLLVHIAKADGEIDERERAVLLAMAETVGKSLDQAMSLAGGLRLEDICTRFAREKAKRIALVELLNIAMTDRVLSADEEAGVHRVATLMGLSRDVVISLQQWVTRGISWKAEGDVLLVLTGGGNP